MTDREEFLKRILQNQEDLRAFIGALILDRHRREDVFQEVMLAMWREADRYDASRSFGAWARGIAAHRILQHSAQEKRFPVAFSPETIDAVLHAYDRTEMGASKRVEALRACLEELPEKTRELLTFRYSDDLKVEQIAARTGQGEAGIYQALSRIRVRLGKCIKRRLEQSA